MTELLQLRAELREMMVRARAIKARLAELRRRGMAQ